MALPFSPTGRWTSVLQSGMHGQHAAARPPEEDGCASS